MPSWAIQLIEAVLVAVLSATGVHVGTGTDATTSSMVGLVAGVAKLLPKQLVSGT